MMTMLMLGMLAFTACGDDGDFTFLNEEAID